MKKLIISGLITMLGASYYISPAFADHPSSITGTNIVQEDNTYMAYIARSQSNLSINTNGVASISSTISGIAGVTKTEINSNLQQLRNGSWTTIKSGSKSGSRDCNFTTTYSVPKGYSYRVSSVVKAYKGTSSETKTVNSASYYY
ncbi:MAG: hypothetical protein RSD22_11020 [Romboutsia sp.]